MKTISIIGPAKIAKAKHTQIQEQIKTVLLQAESDGFDNFMIRAEGDCDHLMAQAVHQLKQEGHELFLEAIRSAPGLPKQYTVDGIYCYPNALSKTKRRRFARDREMGLRTQRLIVLRQADAPLHNRDSYIADTVMLDQTHEIVEIKI